MSRTLFQESFRGVTIWNGVQVCCPRLHCHCRSGNISDMQRSMESLLYLWSPEWFRMKNLCTSWYYQGWDGAPPMVVESMLRSVTFLNSTWQFPQHRYVRLPLESSRPLSSEGPSTPWMQYLLVTDSMVIDALDRSVPFFLAYGSFLNTECQVRSGVL